MSRRKFTRLAVPGLAVLVTAALVVPAFAASSAPERTTLKTIGKITFRANRGISDSMHFNRDVVRVQSGGKIVLVERTKQAHTFSLVRRGEVPGSLREVENCFGRGPCDEIAVAHGAINPDTGEEQDPTTPLVNVGKEGFNEPGDSVLIPPSGRATVKVSAAAGTTLHFICAIHPWMQGKVKVARAQG